MPLTNKKIDGLKPRDKPYKASDAHGLFIAVLPSGIKSWRYLYKVGDKHKTKTFGQYPQVGVAEARQLLIDFKQELKKVNDESLMTMEDLCREWLVYKSPQLVNLKHRQQVQYRVDTFILPDLRKRAIGSLKRSDFVDVVKKVQAQGIVETSHRVASILSQVMDYAVDIGKIESHAANGLSRVLNAPKSKHMNCIDVGNIQKLIEDISSYDEPLVRNALLFACVTFVRTNELRYMTWNEIVDDKFWVIPKERMKLKKLHVVPLSEFSLKLLDNIRTINADYDYVLQSPTKRNSPISENTMLFALYRLGYRHLMTVHGFRALASTILNEQSPFRHDVIERQLAHKETDQVRLAYNRAEYLDERIKLMDWYSSLVSAYVK